MKSQSQFFFCTKLIGECKGQFGEVLSRTFSASYQGEKSRDLPELVHVRPTGCGIDIYEQTGQSLLDRSTSNSLREVLWASGLQTSLTHGDHQTLLSLATLAFKFFNSSW